MLTHLDVIGRIAAQWRYPVKSMGGEDVDLIEVTERGIVGDRAFALVDKQDGKVVSAKNPRKWPSMFSFRASYIEPPRRDRHGTARIELGNGQAVTSDAPDLGALFSDLLGREVTFEAQAPVQPRFECYVPEMDDGSQANDIVTVDMPEGTFFDSCVLHVLTTATLRRLAELYPEGQFDVRRFRPNLVIEVGPDQAGFVENGWIGRELAIGDEVRLAITEPCTRCVMTTLPQSGLPKDPGILRTAAQHNEAAAGVRVAVLRGGAIRRGDPVSVQ